MVMQSNSLYIVTTEFSYEFTPCNYIDNLMLQASPKTCFTFRLLWGLLVYVV